MVAQETLSVYSFINSTPSCEQLVMGLYNLNKLEFNIYCGLLRHGSSTVSEIIDIIADTDKEKDRSIINRALNELLAQSLVNREKLSEEGKRGFWFRYTPKPLEKLVQETLSKFDDWFASSRDKILQIPDEFNKKYSVDKLL
ncbi:MAG: hypothetical protein OEY49_18395 [Candidatus Heimdallarchaeota archaeon]|nr:hypothetical protein [Candidatus Heimdallarchaeota archaeon]